MNNKEDYVKACVERIITEKNVDVNQAMFWCSDEYNVSIVGVPVVEAKISDDDDVDTGVYAMSFVKFPAIESGFVKFDSQRYNNVSLAVVNEEQRIVVGPAMIPGKFIYRKDAEAGEYYMFFAEDTIRQIATHFLESANTSRKTLDHQIDIEASKISLLESWFVDDIKNDKINIYKIQVPKGTWMTSYRVNDESIWNDIKSGKYNGFSIEGLFLFELMNENSIESLVNSMSDSDFEKLEKIISDIDWSK